MEEPFFTFRKFNDPVLAAGMAGKLKEHRIPVEVEDSGKWFDPSFAHNLLEREIRVKLRAGDFEPADDILRDFYRQAAGKIGGDHYLYQFTDLELLHILRNPDEWGYLDQALAQKILQEHGIAIDAAELKRLRAEKIRLLASPGVSDSSYSFLGYVMAVLLPPLGLIIGFSMSFMKKTLPDGRQLFAYHAADRKRGKRIMAIAALCLVFWISAWLWFWKN